MDGTFFNIGNLIFISVMLVVVVVVVCSLKVSAWENASDDQPDPADPSLDEYGVQGD